MVAEQKALLIARALVLITALGVIGLGAWCELLDVCRCRRD